MKNEKKKFKGFSSFFFFYEIQSNEEYHSDSCQTRVSANSWGVSEDGVELMIGGLHVVLKLLSIIQVIGSSERKEIACIMTKLWLRLDSAALRSCGCSFETFFIIRRFLPVGSGLGSVHSGLSESGLDLGICSKFGLSICSGPISNPTHLHLYS